MNGLQKYADIFIRIPVGFHLIYGTQDNIFSWSRMLEFRDFLKNLDVPLALWAAHLSVYAQFFAGIAFILGYQTKWAAVLMIINFVIAIYLVHLTDSYPSKFPAIMMLFSSIFMLFNGDGYFNIESLYKKVKQARQ